MKKILAISASAKKNGAGISALNIFKDKFDDKNYEFKVIHLSDYNINNCIGCTICFKKDQCFMKDDLQIIIDMMKEADGLIFITPIYNMNIAGSLKTLLDRTTYLLHKPVFYDKHSYIISTTDIGGSKLVNSYLKYIMNAYCIDNVGSSSILASKISSDKLYIERVSNLYDLQTYKFKKALEKGREYKPKFTQIIRFNLWRIKALKSKEIYPGDYKYWSREEIIHADYFYPISLCPFKKLFIKIIKAKITRKIDKSM